MKELKNTRITIRFSVTDYKLLSAFAQSTYKSGSISRLIRHYLEPIINSLKKNKSESTDDID